MSNYDQIKKLYDLAVADEAEENRLIQQDYEHCHSRNSDSALAEVNVRQYFHGKVVALRQVLEILERNPCDKK